MSMLNSWTQWTLSKRDLSESLTLSWETVKLRRFDCKVLFNTKANRLKEIKTRSCLFKYWRDNRAEYESA